MKARKIITITLLALAAVAVVALALWRFLPRSLGDVLNGDPGAAASMAAQVAVTGISGGKAATDTYTLEALSPDSEHFAAILEILEGTNYRPDFRNLLPWPLTSVAAEGLKDGRSVMVFLVWGDSLESSATLHLQTESQAVVSLGTEDGFRIYHPTDPEAHAALADYLEAHGVSDGTSPSQPLSD